MTMALQFPEDNPGGRVRRVHMGSDAGSRTTGRSQAERLANLGLTVPAGGGSVRTLPRPQRGDALDVVAAPPQRRSTPTIPVRPRPEAAPRGPVVQPQRRGRRVPMPKSDPAFIRFTLLISLLLVGGVAVTMLFSGEATRQSFELAQLKANEELLDNQIDTLNRNVRNADSAAEIARRAMEMGMVVPDQPGVLAVQPDGTVAQLREADPSKTRPLVDVNGEQIRPLQPTTNPADVAAVAGQVVQAPQAVPGVAANLAPLPAAAPYEATRRD
ncbi:hypothetical protein C1Y63_07795 [Corynebacterium sp. 13CS0277]|uniref:hypothetical protein n=1 Tax=Corynebacterium sp. 13CS0277 TaxID=2071994 RepID=UPI000D02675B|nr:hypothetical protein [Corynebacterium sp. 13CS0277]PRQ11147.1 hypothetical protein C1Y63_07795 [Corynebacterium sp. 13CS0277]